ncbi:MFS transporter [Congregibacter sp.]|uniref:MFS transporter n=1 Tax=Congregibacter sp. TaxID=2744308 RepID=UPI00385D8C25
MPKSIAIDEFKSGGMVLLACFIGVGAGLASLSFYTAGIFMSAFEQEFGWTRAQISLQGLISVGAIALLASTVGSLADRLGARLVATASLFCYSLSFFVLSIFTNSLGAFYAISLCSAILAVGTTPITFTRAITSWFSQSRGLALGITLVGTGVTSLLAPLYLTPYVAENGWRDGLRILGSIVFIAAVLVGLLLRDNPSKEVAEKPSGESGGNDGSYANVDSTRRVFVLLALIFSLVALAVGGMIVHFIPMLNDAEVPPAKAGQLASVIGLSVIVGRLGTGVLIDRFFAPRVASMLFALSALGYTVFILGGAEVAVFAAVAVGLSMGAEVDLIAFLTSRYFRFSSYGKTYGALYAFFVTGAAVSPVLMGYSFDNLGAYDAAIAFSIVCLALASCCALLLPRYPTELGTQ